MVACIPEIFSTVGLVTDVTCVLVLILLSHAEAGMAGIVGTPEGVWAGLVLRFKTMAKRHKGLFALNLVCLLGLVVGTTLMVIGIWM